MLHVNSFRDIAVLHKMKKRDKFLEIPVYDIFGVFNYQQEMAKSKIINAVQCTCVFTRQNIEYKQSRPANKWDWFIWLSEI